MPGTKNVSQNIRELKAADAKRPKSKRRPQKQVVAIALAQARRAGGK